MDLVLDIGNHRIKGALFDGDSVAQLFVLPIEKGGLAKELEGTLVTGVLVSSVDKSKEGQAEEELKELGLPFHLLDFAQVQVDLLVDEPEKLGHDRIANVYGALARFPQNDCVVVDIGTAVTFDYVGCDGSYRGGAIYPGPMLGAQALHAYTDALPVVEPSIPDDAIAKTTETHIQSGLYYGLLGAIERIVFEMQQETEREVKVIATGGFFRTLANEKLASDVAEITDLIDPALTLVGLYEIMKENKEHYNVCKS